MIFYRTKKFLPIVVLLLGYFFSFTITEARQFLPQVINKEELQAYKLFCEGIFLIDSALIRRKVEDIYAKKSDSFVAELLLGWLEYEHGNYPLSACHLKRARSLLEDISRYDDIQKDNEYSNDAPHWYSLILYRLALTYMAMDRLEDELEVLELYARKKYKRFEKINNIITPASSYRIHALIKLGRIDEAYQLAEKLEKQQGLSEKEIQSVHEHFALIQEFRNKNTSFLYSMYSDMVQDLRKADKPPKGNLLNALAYFARLDGRYGESEDALKMSAKYKKTRSPSHPYKTLADIHTSEADWYNAKNALRECWQWLPGKRGYVRQELTKETLLALAEFYLAAGYPESAWRITSQLSDNPVRSGFRWRFSEQWEAGLILVAISSLSQLRKLQTESVSDEGTPRWMGVALKCTSWIREQQMRRKFKALIVKQLSRRVPVINALEFIDIPYWLFGYAVQILGADLSRELLELYPLTNSQKNMFADAIEVEMAYAEQAWDKILTFSNQALDSLPIKESLWRARISAIHGEALRRLGKMDQALSHLEKAYRINPAVYKHLLIRLPVSIHTDDSEISRFVGEKLLTQSPILVKEDNGFVLQIKETDSALRCYLIAKANKVKYFSIAPDESESEKIFRFSMASEIHRQLFTGTFLRQADYDALEGLAVRGPKETEKKKERLDQLMGKTRR